MAASKQSESPRSAGKKPTARSRISNGSELLVGADGRTKWARRLKDLIDDYSSDCGDTGDLTHARRALIRRAATLTVELEMKESDFANAGKADASDLKTYQTASNSLRRLLESAGLAKATNTVKVKDPPFKDVPPTPREAARAIMSALHEAHMKQPTETEMCEVITDLTQHYEGAQEGPEPPENAHMAGTTECIGEGWIECREVANDGREKWAVYSPTGVRLTALWGRDKAEAACKEYLELGTITR